MSVTLRRSLTEAYLDGAEALTHRMLRDRLGKRDFRRVIVVAALGRSNGIASGARLQWEALRSVSIEAEWLEATPALRDPLFRIPHRVGFSHQLRNRPFTQQLAQYAGRHFAPHAIKPLIPHPDRHLSAPIYTLHRPSVRPSPIAIESEQPNAG